MYLKNTLLLFQGDLAYLIEIPEPMLHRNYCKPPNYLIKK